MTVEFIERARLELQAVVPDMRYLLLRWIIGADVDHPRKKVMQDLLKLHPDRYLIESYFHGRLPGNFFRWPVAQKGVLSDIAILRHMVAENLIIDPFYPELLQPAGYDVRVGETFWRFKDPDPKPKEVGAVGVTLPRMKIGDSTLPLVNPFDRYVTDQYWTGPELAITVEEALVRIKEDMKDLKTEEWLMKQAFLRDLKWDDKIIILAPGEMILGHTIEFIGGINVVNTMISGKSTTGRTGIEICSDANMGNVGFFSRWALEIRNKFLHSFNLLVVGQPYAVISFFEVEHPYNQYRGNYQGGQTLKAVRESWTPEDILPKAKIKRLKW